MTVITRFAPSPTGYLHIGGARTALFNWLFAKHMGGKFLLRIEDTDRERSTEDAIRAILDGMAWLGLEPDGDPIFQFARASRHAEVAQELLDKNLAYKCYATPEELDEMRVKAMAEKKPLKYDGRWRDRDPADAPAGAKPVIRIKAPQEGSITVRDHVRGEVTVQASELDDMVLLRSDGTPTYMLAVVVDDHDMNISHVIRGDDHFTNTFRQLMIYNAMNWATPEFAHIPLIHGPDGAKLSKRHGALGVEAYRDMGYLPEALRNYLLRLGWGHGDDEIISTAQAIEWFDLPGVGSSPSRFDTAKLDNLNGHYIREAEDHRLLGLILPLLERRLPLSQPLPEGRGVITPIPLSLQGEGQGGGAAVRLAEEQKNLLLRALPSLKARAKNLNELAESAVFLFHPAPIPVNEAAQKVLAGDAGALLQKLLPSLESVTDWNHTGLEAWAKEAAEAHSVKLGKIMEPLRAAITGTTASPSMFEVMEWLGKAECLNRLKNVTKS